MELRCRTADAPPAPSAVSLFVEWVEWFQFPVKFFVARTIPNMDDPKMQHLYPVSFVMSMLWLAIFAFSVVKACDGIHADFGISDSILGFTVAAAGTSFPNVFSGMCVARQGKTSMAVDNLIPAVAECMITLVPVVLVYLCYSCSMPKWAGALYLVVYGIYLVFALGQQISACSIWPLSCQQ